MTDYASLVTENVIKRVAIPDDLARLIYYLVHRDIATAYNKARFAIYTTEYLVRACSILPPYGGQLSSPIGSFLTSTYTPHQADNLAHDFKKFAWRFSLSENSRFEHQYIIGSTGSGKTQLIQKLILSDLQTEASVIVMAPKGSLIENIARLDTDKHVTLIRPDIPLALNIFDVGDGSVNAIGMIHYIFSSILSSEATGKQTGLLNNCIRLMLVTPGATLRTLRQLLKQPTAEGFDLTKLTDMGQEFFIEQYPKTKVYGETKEQMLQRLDLLLENPFIDRIFSQTKTLFDITKEMSKGNVVLIDTSLRHLGEFGSKFLGRFMIALVNLASQQRTSKRPVYFYIDEAASYLDQNIELILERARESRIGLTLAHQQLAQFDGQLEASVLSNTSTKFIGGCSAQDARKLSQEVHVDALKLSKQKPLHFHVFSKGLTEHAIPIKITPGVMEGMPQRTNYDQLVAENKARYQVATPPPFIPKKVVEEPPSPEDDIETL